MPPNKPKVEVKDINNALLRIKQSVSDKKIEFVEGRKKNLETLASLGITTEIVFDIILELTYRNYLNGPSDDRNFPEDINTIWEFGYELDGQNIYIKIKIVECNKSIVLSFHKAERPLYFYYKD